MCGCDGDPCRDHGSDHKWISAPFCHDIERTPNLFADAGETTSLAALVDGVDDPVNPGVAADLKYFSFKHILRNTQYKLNLQPCGWDPPR